MGTTFDSIARGLDEAAAHAKGKKIAVKTYTPAVVSGYLTDSRAKVEHWRGLQSNLLWCRFEISLPIFRFE